MPVERVASLVDAFLVHPLNHDFQGDSIAGFLRDLPSRGEMSLTSWTVALRTTGTADRYQQSDLAFGSADCGDANKRGVRENKGNGSLLVSGKGARVGDSPDVRHGMPKELARQAEENWRLKEREDHKQRAISGDEYREVMQAPLLLLYLLRGPSGNLRR